MLFLLVHPLNIAILCPQTEGEEEEEEFLVLLPRIVFCMVMKKDEAKEIWRTRNEDEYYFYFLVGWKRVLFPVFKEAANLFYT